MNSKYIKFCFKFRDFPTKILHLYEPKCFQQDVWIQVYLRFFPVCTVFLRMSIFLDWIQITLIQILASLLEFLINHQFLWLDLQVTPFCAIKIVSAWGSGVSCENEKILIHIIFLPSKYIDLWDNYYVSVVHTYLLIMYFAHIIKWPSDREQKPFSTAMHSILLSEK